MSLLGKVTRNNKFMRLFFNVFCHDLSQYSVKGLTIELHIKIEAFCSFLVASDDVL